MSDLFAATTEHTFRATLQSAVQRLLRLTEP